MILRRAAVFAGDINDFHLTFGKKRAWESSRGEMFAAAPPEAVASALQIYKMRQQRKRRQSGEAAQPCSTWRDAVCTGNAKRLRQYEALGQERLEKAATDVLIDAAAIGESGHRADSVQVQQTIEIMRQQLLGYSIVDIGQTPGQKGGSGFSQGVPTLLTQSQLFSFKSDRLLLGAEHLLMQGVPVWEKELDLPFCGSFNALSLSDHSARFVAGNAVHGLCSGVLTAFALVHLALRQVPSVPAAPMSMAEDSGDDDI